MNSTSMKISRRKWISGCVAGAVGLTLHTSLADHDLALDVNGGLETPGILAKVAGKVARFTNRPESHRQR